ncbi:C40 family peptidase, partial [Bradyrhizobium japonicum]|uniref:C40 family peptidase n=1 Tax=Bradyrhizobium japonicum TaxID=375 RepID=UPI001AEC15E0
AVMVSTSLLMFASAGQAAAAQVKPFEAANQAVYSQNWAKSDQVVDLAKSLLGKEYKYGAVGPEQFGSAGLPVYVYGQVGIKLDNSISKLYSAGEKINRGNLQPGDAVFFSSSNSNPNYMGIYIGGDQFIYSSQDKDAVIEKSITADQAKKFVGARRYLDSITTDNGSSPVVTDEPSVDNGPTPDQGQAPVVVPGDSSLGDQIIRLGEKYMGTPYKFGSSSSTTSTFDCSSFVQRVFKEAGIKLPRDSRQQSATVKEISVSQLQKGDLVFFRSYGSSNPRITHVAIYAGNDKLLHTYGSPGVTYSKFSGTSWEKRVQKVGRVIPQ